jgi:hypothetical protein
MGHRVLRVEVEVGRDRAEFHLVQAEVREDRHVPGREHLVEFLAVCGHRNVQGLEYLTGQRIVHRRGEVGEEHRHVIAEDPNRHEKEVVDAGEADGAAHTRLPAQGLDEVVQVGGNRRRQDVGLPLVLFPVDDDREVRLTHVCHRHLTSMLRTEGMLSDGGPSRRQNRRSRPRAAGSGPVAGATCTAGDALLSPIGHTERCTGAYSCRHDGFTA